MKFPASSNTENLSFYIIVVWNRAKRESRHLFTLFLSSESIAHFFMVQNNNKWIKAKLIPFSIEDVHKVVYLSRIRAISFIHSNRTLGYNSQLNSTERKINHCDVIRIVSTFTSFALCKYIMLMWFFFVPFIKRNFRMNWMQRRLLWRYIVIVYATTTFTFWS